MTGERGKVLRALAVGLIALTASLANLWGEGAVRAQGRNAMAVDVLPGGAIDAERTVAGKEPFQVTVNITEVAVPYVAYQFKLQYDIAILEFVSNENHEPGGLNVCPEPFVSESTVFMGCASVTLTPTEFVGVTDTLTFRCIADGTSRLHLMSNDEVGVATGSNMAGESDLIETELRDASVTCSSTGENANPTAAYATATASAMETRVAAGLPPVPGTAVAGQVESAAGSSDRGAPRAGNGDANFMRQPLVVGLLSAAALVGVALAGLGLWRRRHAR